LRGQKEKYKRLGTQGSIYNHYIAYRLTADKPEVKRKVEEKELIK